jgi:hypothetical protein
MNKIKKLAVVVAMASGFGLVGGGLAHAGEGGPGDFTLNNAQPQSCNYNALIPVQLGLGLGILGSGETTAVGQNCSQTGPSLGH